MKEVRAEFGLWIRRSHSVKGKQCLAKIIWMKIGKLPGRLILA